MAFYPNFIILTPGTPVAAGFIRVLVYNESTEEFVETDGSVGSNATINMAASVGQVIRVGIFHEDNASTASTNYYQISSNTPITITRGGLLKSDAVGTTITLTNPTTGNKTTTTSLSNYVQTTGALTGDVFQHSFYFTVPSNLTTVTVKVNDNTSSSTFTINIASNVGTYGFKINNSSGTTILDSTTKVSNVIQTSTLTINHNTPTNIANSNITTTNKDEFDLYVTGPFTATYATFIEGMVTTRYNGGFTVEYETPGGGTTGTFTFTYYIVRF